MGSLTITIGFTQEERPRVASLYWEAFRRKLRPGFSDEATGLAVIQQALCPPHMFIARNTRGVAGVCGFYKGGKGGRGALDLSWPNLRRQLPVQAAFRAAIVLDVLSRTEQPGKLVLDGICVANALRGQGIGTALLLCAIDHARRGGAHAVRLSVVDSNSLARALYERQGFMPVESGSLGALSAVYGFGHYTTLELEVNQ